MDVVVQSFGQHNHRHSIDFVKKENNVRKHTCFVNISVNRTSRCIHTRLVRSNCPSIAIMGECIECGIVDARILHRLVLDLKCETDRHRVNKLVTQRTRDPRVFSAFWPRRGHHQRFDFFCIPPKRLHSRSNRCASLFLRNTNCLRISRGSSTNTTKKFSEPIASIYFRLFIVFGFRTTSPKFSNFLLFLSDFLRFATEKLMT